MLWELLLVVHLVGFVGYTLLLRKSALSGANKLLLAALMQTGIFVPILILIAAGSPLHASFSAWQWFALAVSALCIAGLQLSVIKALQHLEASIFTIVFNLRLFLVTILGFVFLHDLPSVLQMAGGLVIFASILLLNLHKNRQYLSSPVLYGLLATAMISATVTMEKFNLLQVGFTSYMFWSQGMAAVFLWLLALRSGARIESLKKSLDWHTAALVLLRAASGWGYTGALLYGSLAVTGYVSGLGVALIVLFGIFSLNEKQHIVQKLSAVGVAIIGLTLILIGKL